MAQSLRTAYDLVKMHSIWKHGYAIDGDHLTMAVSVTLDCGGCGRVYVSEPT